MSTKFVDFYHAICASRANAILPGMLQLVQQADILVDENEFLKSENKRLLEKLARASNVSYKETLNLFESTRVHEESSVCAPNERIRMMLIELSEIEKTKGDLIRSNVYYNAALAVKAYKKPITSGKAARKALVGVGKSIEAKIDELLKTGTLAKLVEERALLAGLISII